jgi:hypothetical protein
MRLSTYIPVFEIGVGNDTQNVNIKLEMQANLMTAILTVGSQESVLTYLDVDKLLDAWNLATERDDDPAEDTTILFDLPLPVLDGAPMRLERDNWFCFTTLQVGGEVVLVPDEIMIAAKRQWNAFVDKASALV